VEIFQIWPVTEPAFGDMPIRVLGAIILFGLFSVVFIGISYISKFSMLFMVEKKRPFKYIYIYIYIYIYALLAIA